MTFPPRVWRPEPAEPFHPAIDGRGRLDVVERIPVPGAGPEDVLLDGEGGMVVGVDDGRVLRLDLEGGPTRVLADTGGRPLGLEWLSDGDVLVCDAERGLLRVPRDGGPIELLTTHVDGEPLVLTNNAAVEEDGTIWFTESSRVHGLDEFVLDVLEHNGSGRLLRRAPDGEVTPVLGGLSFANGVALVGDDVWVAESGSYAIHRVRRTGPDAGRHDVVTGALPGYPDNLTTGADGTVWAPIPAPRKALGDLLVGLPPIARRPLRHLPDRLVPDPERSAVVIGFAPDGAVRHHLTGAGRSCHFLTGAREHDGWLYLGSVAEDVHEVVRVRIPDGP